MSQDESVIRSTDTFVFDYITKILISPPILWTTTRIQIPRFASLKKVESAVVQHKNKITCDNVCKIIDKKILIKNTCNYIITILFIPKISKT